MAEHERVRSAAVEQPERDARVRRVQQRALALDPDELAAARDALEHELLGGAREEVGDDRVDRDPPPGDRDPGLAGRDELARDPAPLAPRRRARARRSSSRSRSRSRPSARPSSRASGSRRRDVEAGRRLAQVAQLDAVPRRESGQLGIVGDELVQAVLDVEPVRDAALQQLAPGRREAAALRRDADERRGRPEARAPRRPSRRPGSRPRSPPPAPSRGSRRPVPGR